MMASGRRWLFVGIVVVVLAVALGLFLQSPPDLPAVSDDKLHPGGMYRGIDGVSIGAPEESFGQAVEINIIKVKDPRGEVPFPEYLSEAQVVGDFYEITAESDIWPELPYALLLGLPVPEGVSPEKLAVLLLSPPEAIIFANPVEDVDPFRWDILTGAYDPESGLFGTLFYYAGKLPQVISLVEMPIDPLGREMPPDPLGREMFIPIQKSSQNIQGKADGTPKEAPGYRKQLTWMQELFKPGISMAAAGATKHLTMASDDWGLPGLKITGFRVLKYSPETEEEGRRIIKDGLEEAYNKWMRMGFKGPHLRLRISSCSFQDMLMGYTFTGEYYYTIWRIEPWKKPYGIYNILQATGTTFFPANQDPCPIVSRWVLFVAFQYRYEEMLNKYLELVNQGKYWAQYPLVLGTATAAERSLETLTRGHYTGYIDPCRMPMALGSPAFKEFTGWEISQDKNAIFRMFQRSQDFWVYIGKRLNPENPQVSSFIPFYESGGLVQDIDAVLREEGTFESFGAAYWQWAKNHSFEKQVALGPIWSGGAIIPRGQPGEWSEHGLFTPVPLSLASWDSAPDGILTPISDQCVPLTTMVFEITLEPHVSKIYEGTVDVDTTYPDIRYKFYPLAEAGTTACWDEGRDNQPYTFQVEGPVTVYLLISNINLEEDSGAFDVKLTLANTYQRSLAPDIPDIPDIPVLIPEYELKVRASRDGTYTATISSKTGHGGSTDYTIKSIRQGTEVHLQAPEYIGSGASRKVFTGWSGDVTSNQRSITFEMDSNKTLWANYDDSPEQTFFTLTVSSTEDDPDQKVGIDITSKTGHGGRTRYTISSLIAGTQVHLEAPENAGTRVNPKVFSHWSGAVSSTQRHITLVMDGNKSVTAHYISP